jgi:hypothetical protein
MVPEYIPSTEELFDRVEAKFQHFYDALTTEERPIAAALIQHVADSHDTVGYADRVPKEVPRAEWERLVAAKMAALKRR